MGQRSSGGNYPAITQEELGNVVIPFVDNKRQIKIVKHISQIRAQAQQLQTEAEQLLKEARIKIERLILG
jgi:restriction endonuclease S subunit